MVRELIFVRILFISAFYPPHVVGGWEQLIEDVNDHLQKRGHVTCVLTSRYGLDRPSEDGNVQRTLFLESDLQHYRPLSVLTQHKRLDWNLNQTKNTIQEFQPDVVFIQIMWNLSRGVPWMAEHLMTEKIVYYMPSIWAYAPDTRERYWQEPANNAVKQLGKRFIAPISLKAIRREHDRFRLEFRHILCVSEASRAGIAKELGRDVNTLRIVNNGVELDRFYPRPDVVRPRTNPAILFAGTIDHHKGVHTAIEAMAILRKHQMDDRPSLTIVGSGHGEYEEGLRNLVKSEGLEESVTFYGRVPRSEMPSLMRQFDILVLPSIWDEPLSRVMQEAMACGLLVIGTNTGGTGEILVDGETGLVFSPGDAAGLAECLMRVMVNREMGTRLAIAGRQRIVEHFSLERMVSEVEDYLCRVSKDGHLSTED